MQNTPIDFASFKDADNIIVAGASIMERGFKSVPENSGQIAEVQAFAASLGFTGTVRCVAVSGSVATDALAQVTTALETTYAGQKNLVLVHTGGNNVSSNRPYSADQFAALDATLQAIYDVCRENHALLLQSTISRRYYTSEPVTPAGRDDKYGSGYYNEFVVQPYLKRTQRWPGALDMYSLTSRHPEIVSSDGVHPDFTQNKWIAFWLLARAADYIMGRARDVRAGDSFGVSFQAAGTYNGLNKDDDGLSAGVYFTNEVRELRADPAGGYKAGQVLRGVTVGHARTNASSNTGAGAAAVVTDPRLTAAVMQEFISINPADGVVPFRISGLPARHACTVTLAASRNLAGADRKADVAVFGRTYVLDAATDAASNELVVSGETDADGTVLIEVSCEASSAYGYVNAVIVDLA